MFDFFLKKKKSSVFSPVKRGAGFTLIELLVVIAVIGLMTVIVLVALGDNKKRAKETTIKSSLIEVVKSAEFLRINVASYDGVCDPADITLSSDGNFGKLKLYIASQGGTVSCNSTDEAFAVISTLGEADCWCVDWEGASKKIELTGIETCESILISTTCP